MTWRDELKEKIFCRNYIKDNTIVVEHNLCELESFIENLLEKQKEEIIREFLLKSLNEELEEAGLNPKVGQND